LIVNLLFLEDLCRWFCVSNLKNHENQKNFRLHDATDFHQLAEIHECRTHINPDHVKIVINNYRWRLGLTKGEAKI